ncbi:hypothetical protein PG994_009825 [Apiospora phragmitis]|uniref:PKS/mFAS DH domain-containing protein n=1 Tax=Apiospora phragmitis TaxID=2905665 RepID=A0ABR1U798_9PEZI
MTRRAVASPELHTFQSVATPEAAAAELWREGVAATSWRFLTSAESDLHSVWLPPYSFDRPKHWLEHVDHAVEEHKKAQCWEVEIRTSPNLTASHRSWSRTRVPTPANQTYTASVCTRLPNASPESFRATLCAESHFALHQSTWRPQSWPLTSFGLAVQSSSRSTHAEGDVDIAEMVIDPQPDRRLVMDKITALRGNKDSETFKSATAYRLFSRVVEYAGLMQGIANITLGSSEAVAQIQVPKTAFPVSESTVVDFYDAITLDTFIQVLGLLVNHSNGFDSTGGDEIYVASSIGKMELEPADFGNPQICTAYASYSALDSKTTSGDVTVLSEKGEVVFSATDIRFGEGSSCYNGASSGGRKPNGKS